MSNSPFRDQAVTEPLSPAQSLLNWRETRDADRFKEWCLEQFGGYVVLGHHHFHPEQVLRLKEGVIENLLHECRAHLQQQDEETICEQYPAPVAVPYHQFLHGTRDPMRRLTRLRDTWEGLICVLSTLAISEASQIGVGTTPVHIIERGATVPAKAKDLRSDRLSARIGLLDGLIESWRAGGKQAAVAELVPTGVTEELRRLNSVRNGFSHLGTLSDVQARQWILEAAPLVHGILTDLLDLSGVQLFRLSQFVPGSPPIAEVESLNGHTSSRRITDLPLDVESAGLVLRAGKIGTYDRVLAKVGTRLLDLSPYYYAFDDASGHHTSIAYFKKRSDDQCHLEIVGDSTAISSDQSLHAAEFDRCERNIVGQAGGASNA